MQIKDIAPSYGVATVVALSVTFLKYLPISNWVILPMQIVIGIIVFYVICHVLGLKEFHDIKDLLKPMLSRKKR